MPREEELSLAILDDMDTELSRMSSVTISQEQVDDAAIAPFKNDLKNMTEAQIEEEYQRATRRMEDDEAWIEAVCAWRRQKKHTS